MRVNTNVASVLAMGAERLRASAAAAASAALDAGLLLAHTLRTTRVRLMSDGASAVEPAALERYRVLIERRARGEPLAYLTGTREFWSLPLRVSGAVLVPRPETELLVERALALRAAPEGRVVDLGTGSGAIALALAHERPRWQRLQWRAPMPRDSDSAASTFARAAGSPRSPARASISS